MKYLSLTMLLFACEPANTELKSKSIDLYDLKSRWQDSMIKRNDSIIKEQEKEIRIMKEKMKR